MNRRFKLDEQDAHYVEEQQKVELKVTYNLIVSSIDNHCLEFVFLRRSIQWRILCLDIDDSNFKDHSPKLILQWESLSAEIKKDCR